VQTIFGSFFIGLLTMRASREENAVRPALIVEERTAEHV
jgi:hypothetical protein